METNIYLVRVKTRHFLDADADGFVTVAFQSLSRAEEEFDRWTKKKRPNEAKIFRVTATTLVKE